MRAWPVPNIGPWRPDACPSPGRAFAAATGALGMGVLFARKPPNGLAEFASWVGYGFIYTLWLKRDAAKHRDRGLWRCPAALRLGGDHDGEPALAPRADHLLDATPLLAPGHCSEG